MLLRKSQTVEIIVWHLEKNTNHIRLGDVKYKGLIKREGRLALNSNIIMFTYVIYRLTEIKKVQIPAENVSAV